VEGRRGAWLRFGIVVLGELRSGRAVVVGLVVKVGEVRVHRRVAAGARMWGGRRVVEATSWSGNMQSCIQRAVYPWPRRL
jgi:hypothetical protein